MSEPFVSIIMRSYNEGWALRDTLPALQAQDYQKLGIDRHRFRFDGRFGGIDPAGEAGAFHPDPAARIQSLPRDEPGDATGAVGIRHFSECGRHAAGRELAASARGGVAGSAGRGGVWTADSAAGLPGGFCARLRAVFRAAIANRREWDHFFSMVSSGLRKGHLDASAGSSKKCNTPRTTNTRAGAAQQGYRGRLRARNRS